MPTSIRCPACNCAISLGIQAFAVSSEEDKPQRPHKAADLTEIRAFLTECCVWRGRPGYDDKLLVKRIASSALYQRYEAWVQMLGSPKAYEAWVRMHLGRPAHEGLAYSGCTKTAFGRGLAACGHKSAASGGVRTYDLRLVGSSAACLASPATAEAHAGPVTYRPSSSLPASAIEARRAAAVTETLAFIHDCCTRAAVTDVPVPAAIIYQRYLMWHRATKGGTPFTKTFLGRQLAAQGYKSYVRDRNCYSALRLLSEGELALKVAAAIQCKGNTLQADHPIHDEVAAFVTEPAFRRLQRPPHMRRPPHGAY